MNRTEVILFIDDDAKAGELWVRFLRSSPYQVHVSCDPHEALSFFKEQGADLIISDLRMPGMDGIELLKTIRDRDTNVPVIITTAYANVDAAISALRLGASDFIKKPYDLEELLILVEKTLKHDRLEQENRLLKRQIKDEQILYGMVGNSSVLQGVHRMIDKLAEVTCNVIIQGESGTGKELVARAIHNLGPRSDQPFVVIDCGGITDALLESELFGHRRGAFTGADTDRKGLLEAAGNGTVFLDEIGNISQNMQVKLLRVLQEGTVIPVGSTRSIAINARFITASNRDLRQLASEGQFRHDLYHRLNVVTLNMPTLDARRQDIPLMLDHFAKEFAKKYHRPERSFSSRKIKALCIRPWAGNIRELRNYVERCVIMSEGELLDIEDACLDQPLESQKTALDQNGVADRNSQILNLDQIEANYIQRTLESVDGNYTQAARLLGIDRTTLWRKLKKNRNGSL